MSDNWIGESGFDGENSGVLDKVKVVGTSWILRWVRVGSNLCRVACRGLRGSGGVVIVSTHGWAKDRLLIP